MDGPRRGRKGAHLPTEDPETAAARLIEEADAIKAEYDSLILHVMTPQRAKRQRELGKRMGEISVSIGHLLTREMAIEMAVRQRLGRTNVEGETILPEDEAAADLMLAQFNLGA